MTGLTQEMTLGRREERVILLKAGMPQKDIEKLFIMSNDIKTIGVNWQN